MSDLKLEMALKNEETFGNGHINVVMFRTNLKGNILMTLKILADYKPDVWLQPTIVIIVFMHHKMSVSH